MALDVEFSHLLPEMFLEQLRSEIANFEAQRYSRMRDRAKWLSLDPAKVRAAEHDERWFQTALQRKKQELGQAEFDIEVLELSLQVSRAELAAWEAKAPAEVIG